MNSKTLLEDVNRQRSLMNLPLITEGLEEEGWGANLAAGTMLTLATLLPGMVQTTSAQSPDGSKTEQASTRQSVDSNRLNQILKTLKSQGWMSESNMHDLFKYIDHLPSGYWGIADGEGKTSEMAKRNVDVILNTMDKSRTPHNSASDLGQGGIWQPRLDAEKKPGEVPRFVIFKQKQNGTWEAMGFILTLRTQYIGSHSEEQPPAPEATASQNVQELQFESINRQRALMGLPLLKEGLEEEGFGRNLVAGVGLTLMSLLPGMMSAQKTVSSADGTQTQQAVSNRPVDEAQLEQILMRLKDQGFAPQEGWDMVSRTLDSSPNSMWIVANAGGKVEMQAARCVNTALNMIEDGRNVNYASPERRGMKQDYSPAEVLAGQKPENVKAPRFLLYKHIPAVETGNYDQRTPGRWEVVGVMVVQRSAPFNQGASQQTAPETPQTTNPSGL